MAPTILDALHITTEIFVTVTSIALIVACALIIYNKVCDKDVYYNDMSELYKMVKICLWVWAVSLLIMSITYYGQPLSIYKL